MEGKFKFKFMVSNENLSSHDELHDTFSEVAGQNYIANNLTNDNHATTTTTFYPQVSARFSNFPQSSYTSWSSVLHEGGTSMRNDRFPHVPSPISSAVRGTNSSIGYDHTMKSEGFGTPGFSSSINGGYTSQEYYEFNSNADQRDPMECVDEYLVHNYDWVDEYLVNNCEISKSKGDC
ncbi:hypothetical protein HAX54_045995 [Datura stramonium]|uniref:Uncharacterized protein n=1 Tax=Datura stramonium TaxID=4076 RepID=A0ABS8RRB7_DATST|nr:hypothetical protein [Datura stramonium]